MDADHRKVPEESPHPHSGGHSAYARREPPDELPRCREDVDAVEHILYQQRIAHHPEAPKARQLTGTFTAPAEGHLVGARRMEDPHLAGARVGHDHSPILKPDDSRHPQEELGLVPLFPPAPQGKDRFFVQPPECSNRHPPLGRHFTMGACQTKKRAQ
jgi:hypothetical protein